MTIDLKAIRQAAEAATKGEWKAVEKYDAEPNEGTHFIMCHGALGYWRGGKSYHTDDTWVMDKADATHIATANPATILELLDRLEAAERERDEFLTALAECRDAMPDTAADINEAISFPTSVPAYVRESVSMLVPKQLLEAAEKDAARMNWLEQNLFNRENIDWLTKKPCAKFNMWVLFSPKGVQGSARGIIDAAMEE